MQNIGNWQKNAKNDFQAIKAGSPSSYWSSGLQKRFDLIQEVVDLKGKKLLDVGCGIGLFMNKFAEAGAIPTGVEPDEKKVKLANDERVKLSSGEKLPFADETFDIVFMHEVLEHVDDDQLTINEIFRVLKKEGVFINFVPNRLFPFETHGIYLFGKYIFGNIPLVTYCPYLYNRLTPHVRNYYYRNLRNLYSNHDYEVLLYTRVFPGFDGLSRRFGSVGRVLSSLLLKVEKSPLNIFGISHVLIVRKK